MSLVLLSIMNVSQPTLEFTEIRYGKSARPEYWAIFGIRPRSSACLDLSPFSRRDDCGRDGMCLWTIEICPNVLVTLSPQENQGKKGGHVFAVSIYCLTYPFWVASWRSFCWYRHPWSKDYAYHSLCYYWMIIMVDQSGGLRGDVLSFLYSRNLNENYIALDILYWESYHNVIKQLDLPRSILFTTW